ncbi:MAG TPA: DsbA family protein [Candidatus Micrarchaeia archaeon]|nr:DsbA family protein [Candidatus Micrarchaeia archaeon]
MTPPTAAVTEHVRFHVDPLCPWAWVTSRWIVRVAAQEPVRVDWALFALSEINRDNEATAARQRAASGRALQLLALVRETGGQPAIGRLYTALGEARHTRGEALADDQTLSAALAEAGLGAALLGRADREADRLWEIVLEDHRAAVDRCGAFGVPTLILDGGAGPGMFGPVVSPVPDDAESVELFRDVVRCLRRPYLFELKRERGETRALVSDPSG